MKQFLKETFRNKYFWQTVIFIWGLFIIGAFMTR